MEEAADVRPVTAWDIGFYCLIAILVYRLLMRYLFPAKVEATVAKTPAAAAFEKANNTYFTPEEVAKHNTKDDCWLIVDAKVYDVTAYVEDHVGGEEAISKHAGRDNTEGFYGKQHPEKVSDMIKEYFIGHVREGKKAQ